MSCALCGGSEEPFWEDRRRTYVKCRCCHLVSVPSQYWLSLRDERREYDFHQNSPEDLGYRRFLSRLADPLLQRLPESSVGLDFGSGPGPTLSVMLEEAGHAVSLYDQFYETDTEVFTRTYDFITATEVLEHLREPRLELDRLWRCLRPGGWLGVMTQCWTEAARFQTWRYKEDPTHIRFFNAATLRWLATEWGVSVELFEGGVACFRKPS